MADEQDKSKALDELVEFLKTLPPDVRAMAKSAIKREMYRRDYVEYAEAVLLADENGKRGTLNAFQKEVVGLPSGGQLLACTARQL